MFELAKITFLGTMAGIIGTGLGGLLLTLGRKPQKESLSFLFSLASGVMLAVVFQDLIPEALVLGGLGFTFLGIVLGVIAIFALGTFLPEGNGRSLARTGLLVGLGITLHNLPEGLAIGAGYLASPNLGLSLAIALCLHDIPEGMAMAAPLLAAGYSKTQVVLWTILAGLPMGLGSFIGAILGTISPGALSGALGFAAGAMLFLIFHELLPQAQQGKKPLASTIVTICGILIGLSFLIPY